VKGHSSIYAVSAVVIRNDRHVPLVFCVSVKDVTCDSSPVLLTPGNALNFRRFAPNDMIITYDGADTLYALTQLGFALPRRHIDLRAEFCNQVNGDVNSSKDKDLRTALEHYGLGYDDHICRILASDAVESGAPLPENQVEPVRKSCLLDVKDITRLFRLLSAKIEIRHALIRGQYVLSCAVIQETGIPVDSSCYWRIKSNLERIHRSLIDELDREYQVYENYHFSQRAFARYIRKAGWNWPRTATGKLCADADTMKEMALVYPQLYKLKVLLGLMSLLNNFSLPIGADSRIRFAQRPFAAVTGRNQPLGRESIFSKPKWLRGLIKPGEGHGMAYIDFSQQEFGIAAALSGDRKMQEAYQSEDPYLAMARQAGRLRQGASAEEMAEIRKLFKMVVLATQYSMGEKTLASRLQCSVYKARELLALHRRLYHVFWEWSKARSVKANIEQEIVAVLGWRMRVYSGTNPRTVQNFPMQANGSEILRLACIYAHESNVTICATVHDALLIEAPLDQLESAAERTQAAMVRAGAEILGGFKLKTDIEYIRYPDRFLPEEGKEIWELVQNMITERAG